jgi:hypothetical protein
MLNATAPETTARTFKPPLAIGLVAFAFFLGNLISRFPGLPNADSDLQYAQAVSGHFSDWQPPIMAWLWSDLRLIVDGSGPVFALQVFCYWLGFGLIAATLSRIGRNRAAWAVIAVGLLPPILMLNIEILKDVGVAVTFLSSFAIFFWYRAQNIKLNPAAAIIAVMLLLYGSLVRANAVFAVPPLLAYMFYPTLLSRPIRFLATSLIIVVVAIPAANAFNHKALHAESTDPLRSLEVFDVAGIAHFAGDMSVLDDRQLTEELLAECYTPVLWDTLGNGKKCRVFWNSLGPQPTKAWIAAIIRHPLAYAEHRMLHFSSELGSYFPRHHVEDSQRNWMVFIAVKPVALKERIVDWIRFSAVFIPWFSLVLGVMVLSLLLPQRETQRPSLNNAAFCLATSGLFYMIAYLFIGVASDFRYQYWDMIAIFVASVICVSERRDHFVPLSRVGKGCIGVLALAFVVIQIVQMFERDSLFRGGIERDERTKQQITPS